MGPAFDNGRTSGGNLIFGGPSSLRKGCSPTAAAQTDALFTPPKPADEAVAAVPATAVPATAAPSEEVALPANDLPEIVPVDSDLDSFNIMQDFSK